MCTHLSHRSGRGRSRHCSFHFGLRIRSSKKRIQNWCRSCSWSPRLSTGCIQSQQGSSHLNRLSILLQLYMRCSPPYIQQPDRRSWRSRPHQRRPQCIPILQGCSQKRSQRTQLVDCSSHKGIHKARRSRPVIHNPRGTGIILHQRTDLSRYRCKWTCCGQPWSQLDIRTM